MFYTLIKIYARWAIKLYCKKIKVNKPDILKIKGPVLFAANHPNSFLDGIILTTLLDAPLNSLARGDAFQDKRMAAILKRFKLLPVYRNNEGIENLYNNYQTFAHCLDVFKEKGMVLIFSEERCVNEWRLRILRKGTARLAFMSWQQGLDLKVIPLGFNYDGYKSFGKTIHLNFGEPISAQSFNVEDSEGKQLKDFNKQLHNQLQSLVYTASNAGDVKRFFSYPKPSKNIILLLPGIAGWLLHAPLFYVCVLLTHLFFKNSDHYDSVLHSLLLVTYPFYLVFLVCIFWNIAGAWSLCLLLINPLTAWCWLQVKHLFSSSAS